MPENCLPIVYQMIRDIKWLPQYMKTVRLPHVVVILIIVKATRLLGKSSHLLRPSLRTKFTKLEFSF